MKILNSKNTGTYALVVAVGVSILILVSNSIFSGAPTEIKKPEEYVAQGALANQWIALATVIGVAINVLIAFFIAKTYKLSEKHGQIELIAYPIINIDRVQCHNTEENCEIFVEGYIKNYGRTVAIEGSTSIVRRDKDEIWPYEIITLREKEWSIAPDEKSDIFLHIKCEEPTVAHINYSIFFEYEFRTIFKQRYRFVDKLEFSPIKGVNGTVEWSLLRKESLQ